MSIEPDTKDWTWVLDRACPECGYVAGDVTADRFGALVRDNATSWEGALSSPLVRERPQPHVWSTLEYACHVRDVHRVFAERLRLMLAQETPTFPNWDQDATAVEQRYAEQDPALVGAELLDAAADVADLYDHVPPDAWGRRGVRSNGSEFSVESLGRYHLHDIEHHLWDVERDAGRRSPAAMPERVRAVLDRLVDLADAGTRVLEVEDAPLTDPEERDAEERDAEERDAEEYDAVWAGPSVADLASARLAVLVQRAWGVTRPGGVLYLSVRGREAPLRAVLEGAGWDVLEVGHSVGRTDGRDPDDQGCEVWLDVLARRGDVGASG